MRASLAPATRKIYRRTLRELAKFLGFSSIVHISSPFGELDIVRYIAFLYANGFSYASILSRLSAVSFWCRAKKWPLVTQSFHVSRALRGSRLSVKAPLTSKFPITPNILSILCQAIVSLDLSTSQKVCLKAMFLVAYHAFLRVGEMCASRHAIRREDVSVYAKFIYIRFSSYKFSLGRCPCIFIPAQSSSLCPVSALIHYLNLRGPAPGYLFLGEDRAPISSQIFRAWLARAVKVAGLSSVGITPHSFRVGAATAAAVIGIPEETIQRMGRWSSRAFMRYIKIQVNKV